MIFRNGFESVGSNVTISSFTVTPSVIETGETVAVAWNVSNATSCNASGNAPGWTGAVNAVAGNQNVTIGTAGSYTFTLTCNNATNMLSESEFVTVTDPVTNCTPPTLAGTIRSWSSEFIGSEWPFPTNEEKQFGVTTRAGYTALEFNTGTSIATGGMVTAEVTTNNGSRLGSISPCPGDFSDVPNNCVKSWGLISPLKWSTLLNPPGDTCKLEANTTYYFNMTFTDGISAATDTCQIFSGTTCFTILRVYKQ